jgi:hypothetical protein
MPKSLRNVAIFHCLALIVLLAGGLSTARLPWFALLAVLALAPLGPLLFIDRPLMWSMAKFAAYGFAFLSGIWLMYAAFGLRGVGDVPEVLLYLLLAVYFVGVGGFLKSAPIRRHFRLPAAE